MVNKLDAVDLVALSAIRGIEGLPAGMFIDLQELMSGQGHKEGIDHPELANLVKNLLEASSPTSLKDVTHFKSLISTFFKISPDTMQASERGELPPNSLGTVSAKPNQEWKSPFKEKEAENAIAQKPQGIHQTHRAEEYGHKFQHLPSPPDPIQQALKEVALALKFIIPSKERRETDRADPTRSAVSPEALTQPTKEAERSLALQQRPAETTEKKAHPTIHSAGVISAKSEMKPQAESTLNQRPAKEATPLKEQKKEAALLVDRQQAPLEKKEAAILQNLAVYGRTSEQPNPQPRQIDRNTISGAPFQAQFSAPESRRKEKRKYPHYFSDREEGEDDEQNDNPKQQK